MTTSASQAAVDIERLIEVVARLRGPDGCSWDRQQTIDSLKPYVLEEAYEVLEAIDQHDHRALCEELGDYLFEAIFVAHIEAEAGHFSIADAARCAADKLIRRHPHVFAREAGQPDMDPAAVRAQWEQIKARERGERATPRALLSGAPGGLPALLRAFQIGGRAASVGFDWVRAEDVVAKIQEEVDEIRDVVGQASGNSEQIEEEVGDLLFAIANLSRKLGVEPESALRKANVKFAERFASMQERVTASGRMFSDLSLEEMESEWRAVKQIARQRPLPPTASDP
jgi:tetrapyrrole methylase family protein/MazG family protein/ATP diphosphatase